MLKNEKNRTYVFHDVHMRRDIECGFIAAAGYFNQGARQRFQYVRSFLPVATEFAEMERTDGQKVQKHTKIAAYKETDVSTEYPSFVKAMVKSHKQPKTWLSATATELPEPPDGFDR